MVKHQLLIACLLITSFVHAQVPTQTVRGTVLDASTRETLPNANVVIVENNMGTVSDVDGTFEIKDVPVGRYTLKASYLGYETATIPEVVVGSGKEVVLSVELEEEFSELDEVMIKSSVRKDRPINSMATVSARTFSVEEARRYAGALDDPGRMAGNFAGVMTAGINVNAIVVRGNAPKGLLWRLEGVDIPVPSHFSGASVAGGGGLTMFSSQMLDNSDFYTGAFPAEFGNATAGVFDMKLRNGNNRQKEYAAQVGVQGVEASAEGPLKEGGESSFLFNYRYSTMALVFKFLPETSGGNEVPVYQDLSFKLNMPAGNTGTFSLWGIGGLSESTFKGYDDPDKWTYPENRERMNFEYNMGAGGVTHKKSLSEKTFLRTTLALNAGQHVYRERLRLDEDNPTKLTPLQLVDNVTGKVAISSMLDHKFNSRLSLRAGIDANRHFYELEGEALDFETGYYGRFLEGSGKSWLTKGHIQGKYKFFEGIALTGGLNISRFQLNDELRFEPRLSAEWQVNPLHRFSFGYGRHSQIEPLFVYYAMSGKNYEGDELYPNKNLKRTGAKHFVLGYDWTPNDYFRVKVEPYYQLLDDVPVVDETPYSMLNFRSDWTFDEMLKNGGTGKNIGVDVTIERFLKDGFYYMTTASLYDSKYTGGDGVERRTRYDGGYVINLLGGKEWQIRDKNLLGLNFKFTFMGPHWFHPVDEEATHLAGDIVYDRMAPFNDRHSNPETNTDMTLTYRINGANSSSVLALQVKNLLGRQYQGKQYNLEEQSIEDEFFYSAIPFISYKIEF